MSKANPMGAVAAGILIFVLGLSVGIWTIEQARAEQERLAASARTDGTVTSHLNGHPVVSFSLPGGDRVSFTETNAGSGGYPVGREVDVLYRTDLPSNAVIDRPHARWMRLALLGALSAVVMAFGGYVAWYARNYDLRRGQATD
jgi:Protein of unknown function (DUF3592)